MLVLYNVCETTDGAEFSERVMDRDAKNGNRIVRSSHVPERIVQVVRDLAQLPINESGHAADFLPLLEEIFCNVQCRKYRHGERWLLGKLGVDGVDHFVNVRRHLARKLLALSPERVLRTEYSYLDALLVGRHLPCFVTHHGLRAVPLTPDARALSLEVRVQFRDQLLYFRREKVAFSSGETHPPLLDMFCSLFPELRRFGPDLLEFALQKGDMFLKRLTLLAQPGDHIGSPAGALPEGFEVPLNRSHVSRGESVLVDSLRIHAAVHM